MPQITLADSRVLSYAEYGEAYGKPVFFFHGAPGSRLFHPPDEVTKRLGVRLICVDRPGYGESTFQANRQILDWPKDVNALADVLGIDSFFITAHSAGTPYALACGYSLPERVAAVAILSGAGPVDAPGATEGMTWINWLGFKFGQYVPWPVARTLTWALFREPAAHPERAIDLDKRERCAADEAIMKMPGVREVCIQSDVGAYRQGLIGFSWEVRLITRHWGFPLEKITVPVYLWHGTADNFASVHMARYMAAKIPGSKACICEGEGHLLLFPRWEEILTTLTQL